MKTTKTAMARAAHECDEKTFEAYCERHDKVTLHHVTAKGNNGGCVECRAENDARKLERQRTDAAYAARRREQRRIWGAEQRATNPLYAGKDREASAVTGWRKRETGKNMLAEGFSERNLPAWYRLEREDIQAVYAAAKKHENTDHITPSNGGIVTGLHTLSNLENTHGKHNKHVKGTLFDPDRIRKQRPANRYSGGAWDPELTDAEKAQARRIRIPMEDAKAHVAASFEADALAYETHIAKIEQRISEQWQNALALMWAYAVIVAGGCVLVANDARFVEAA
jgi:hypothetical protein